MRRALALLAAGVVLLAACGSSAPSPSAAVVSPATGSPAPAPGSPPPASPVVGIVTTIDSRSLGDVRGFTLRTRDGQQLQFRIGTLDNGASFPPGHLAEHQATAEPVRVFFRPGPDGLVVYHIEDAGSPPSDSPSPS